MPSSVECTLHRPRRLSATSHAALVERVPSEEQKGKPPRVGTKITIPYILFSQLPQSGVELIILDNL
jgi:hypothetical protein